MVAATTTMMMIIMTINIIIIIEIIGLKKILVVMPEIVGIDGCTTRIMTLLATKIVLKG